MRAAPAPAWNEADAYESYVGRWSRPVAEAFLEWLAPASALRWLDVGCGTGALTRAIADRWKPARIIGLDRSSAYVEAAEARVPMGLFATADAGHLPLPSAQVDVAVSGLVLNFVPDPSRMVAEMARVVRPGGAVALYVWDYAGEMELMRRMWDAAVELDPDAAERDEGQHFTICAPEPLRVLFQRAALDDVAVRAIDVPTVFRDFDDYWLPFLGGQGPAPGYVMSLDERRRADLRERLRRSLPRTPSGSIPLVARAWAVRGVRVNASAK